MRRRFAKQNCLRQTVMRKITNANLGMCQRCTVHIFVAPQPLFCTACCLHYSDRSSQHHRRPLCRFIFRLQAVTDSACSHICCFSGRASFVCALQSCLAQQQPNRQLCGEGDQDRLEYPRHSQVSICCSTCRRSAAVRGPLAAEFIYTLKMVRACRRRPMLKPFE